MQAGMAEQKVVIFSVGREEYAVAIDSVKEVESWRRPTPVPEAPATVEGVIDLRGDIIPVMDLAKRFATQHTRTPEESRIMVMEIGGRQVGFVVDEVTEVHSVAAGAVTPPSPLLNRRHADPVVQGILKVGTRLVILVDAGKILAEAVN